jgi:small conductance mechanosensitive channel
MLELLQQGDWTAVSAWLLDKGSHVLVIVVLALIALLVLRRTIPQLITRAIKQDDRLEEEVAQRRETLTHVILLTGESALLIAVIFMTLSEIGLDVTPILAGVGIVGVALGFGAQHLVRDVINGIFILAEDQYGKGDFIAVSGVSGLVEEVNLRRTILRDLDGTVHTVANSSISTSSNMTKDWSRVNINVTVAYSESIDRLMELINRTGESLAEDPEWQDDIISPPHVLRLEAVQNSGITVKILGETKPMRQWDVMSELRRRLKHTFDEEGIEVK